MMRSSSEVAVELEAVPGVGTQLPGASWEHQLLTYRVQLEVDDDAVLPTYIPGEPGWE